MASMQFNKEAIGIVVLALAVTFGMVMLVETKNVGVTDATANASIDDFIIGLTKYGDLIVLFVLGTIIVALLVMLRKLQNKA